MVLLSPPSLFECRCLPPLLHLVVLLRLLLHLGGAAVPSSFMASVRLASDLNVTRGHDITQTIVANFITGTSSTCRTCPVMLGSSSIHGT